jgi:N-acetylglucosaminyldiphosphoundecaprenol N-acetyl-beta-D-mannosaminyltransferase
MLKVAGISMYDGNLQTLIAEMIVQCQSADKNNYCISATGAHGIVEANKNPAFKKVLDAFYLNIPDGMPTVWVGQLKGAPKMRRCYGPDFFKKLLIASAERPILHFFCGGKEGIADNLQLNCVERFGNSHVVGTFCPPFREMSDAEMKELGQSIKNAEVDIVWIGLSTPKQEKFAIRLAEFTQTKFIITVGAAFDFHTDQVKQAPQWMQKSGLEWFFRLLMEPKRLFMRYFEIVPKFIWLNIKEFFDFYIVKRKVT